MYEVTSAGCCIWINLNRTKFHNVYKYDKGNSIVTKKESDSEGKSITDKFRSLAVKTKSAKKLVSEQFDYHKKESSDMKEIFESDNLVFYKTEELVVVLRKLGGLYEFLEAFRKLTKEGYTLVWAEPTKQLPGIANALFNLGAFYYFQNLSIKKEDKDP